MMAWNWEKDLGVFITHNAPYSVLFGLAVSLCQRLLFLSSAFFVTLLVIYLFICTM
jgi:hypothetical protein